jgi:hypothetical protein
MWVLHLGYDLHLNRLKPHKHNFRVTQNVDITFRVGYSYNKV